MSTRVEILKENHHSIRFPDVCPVCKKQQPDSHINLRADMAANQPVNEPLGKHWSVTIPVCKVHKSRLKGGRILSASLLFLMIIISMIAFYGFWSFTQNFHWLIHTIGAIALLVIAIYLHGRIYTAPLLFNSFSYKLLFTFKHNDLAERFAIINDITEVYDTMNHSRKVLKRNNDIID